MVRMIQGMRLHEDGYFIKLKIYSLVLPQTMTCRNGNPRSMIAGKDWVEKKISIVYCYRCQDFNAVHCSAREASIRPVDGTKTVTVKCTVIKVLLLSSGAVLLIYFYLNFYNEEGAPFLWHYITVNIFALRINVKYKCWIIPTIFLLWVMVCIVCLKNPALLFSEPKVKM